MTALTASRITTRRPGDRLALIVAAAVQVFQGGMIGVKPDGTAVPASADPTLFIPGIADRDAAAGKPVEALKEIAVFENSAAADEVTKGNIGDDCFVVDDQTVALTNAGGTRPRAGKVFDVDAYGVWVDFRSALDAKTMIVPLTIETLVGANAYRAVAPVAGKITKVWSITEGVLTTGDATLTGRIGATLITNGVITIAQAGSAAGDVDSATPTANNVVVAGDGISFTVGGTNATASKARLFVEITH